MSCLEGRFCSSVLYFSPLNLTVRPYRKNRSSAISSSSRHLRNWTCPLKLEVSRNRQETECCMSLDPGVSRMPSRGSLFFMWDTQRTSCAEHRLYRASWTAVHRQPSLPQKGGNKPTSRMADVTRSLGKEAWCTRSAWRTGTSGGGRQDSWAWMRLKRSDMKGVQREERRRQRPGRGKSDPLRNELFIPRLLHCYSTNPYVITRLHMRIRYYYTVITRCHRQIWKGHEVPWNHITSRYFRPYMNSSMNSISEAWIRAWIQSPGIMSSMSWKHEFRHELRHEFEVRSMNSVLPVTWIGTWIQDQEAWSHVNSINIVCDFTSNSCLNSQ